MRLLADTDYDDNLNNITFANDINLIQRCDTHNRDLINVRDKMINEIGPHNLYLKHMGSLERYANFHTDVLGANKIIIWLDDRVHLNQCVKKYRPVIKNNVYAELTWRNKIVYYADRLANNINRTLGLSGEKINTRY
jgi:hypothetical protein